MMNRFSLVDILGLLLFLSATLHSVDAEEQRLASLQEEKRTAHAHILPVHLSDPLYQRILKELPDTTDRAIAFERANTYGKRIFSVLLEGQIRESQGELRFGTLAELTVKGRRLGVDPLKAKLERLIPLHMPLKQSGAVPPLFLGNSGKLVGLGSAPNKRLFSCHSSLGALLMFNGDTGEFLEEESKRIPLFEKEEKCLGITMDASERILRLGKNNRKGIFLERFNGDGTSERRELLLNAPVGIQAVSSDTLLILDKVSLQEAPYLLKTFTTINLKGEKLTPKAQTPIFTKEPWQGLTLLDDVSTVTSVSQSSLHGQELHILLSALDEPLITWNASNYIFVATLVLIFVFGTATMIRLL